MVEEQAKQLSKEKDKNTNNDPEKNAQKPEN